MNTNSRQIFANDILATARLDLEKAAARWVALPEVTLERLAEEAKDQGINMAAVKTAAMKMNRLRKEHDNKWFKSVDGKYSIELTGTFGFVEVVTYRSRAYGPAMMESRNFVEERARAINVC